MRADDQNIKSKEIKIVPVGELIPNPKNPNSHSKEQIERLVKIISYSGFRSPIIVSNQTGFINVGHGRWAAAKKLGLKSVPVIYQDFDDEAQEYQNMIADNAIAAWSELDLGAINTEMLDLGPDFDVDLLGLKDFTIELPMELGAGDPDEVPEALPDPKVVRGEVFVLGKHRMMCGDSTSVDDVEKLMNKSVASIGFTSPPYNLGDNAKLRGYNGDGDDSAYLSRSDHKTDLDYFVFLKSFTSLMIMYSEVCFVNIQLLAGNKTVVPDYWQFFKNNLIDLMIWDKEHAQPSAARRVLNSVFEMIFIFCKDNNPTRTIKSAPDFRGDISNIFRLNPVRGGKDSFQKNHGAVFPVAFAEHFIEKFGGESVLDLFGGSGTTMIAAEKLGRSSFLMEIEPIYCGIILDRWQKFTGKKAHRESDKKPWDEIKAAE